MASGILRGIIILGNSVTALKYYSLAAATIFFYDFFLTLADEIEYAWKGRKSWVFAIFLANRYLPIGYLIWFLHCLPTPAQRVMIRRYLTKRCDKTSFVEVLATVVPTFLAQVVLTMRIYAITSKNRIIASCFGVITVLQFVLGLYITVYAAKGGVVPIPLPIYVMCIFVGPWLVDIGFATISLVYDFLAFSLIVYLVVRSYLQGVPIPKLLKIMVRDATYYFLFIFSSHLVVVLFQWAAFAEFKIKLVPASGNSVYLPVMITRLMLSLKKANASQERGWGLGEPTTHTTMRFAERRGGVSMGDEIRLDTFMSMHEGAQSLEVDDSVKDSTGDFVPSHYRPLDVDDLAA